MLKTIAAIEKVLRERRVDRPAGSYSAELFNDPERIQRKIMEEAFETCLELGRPHRDAERVTSEAADLVFHLLVGLVECNIPFDAVVQELEQRRQ